MAGKDHDIDIQIGAEIDGLKEAFALIRKQAAELRAQLRPTAEAMQEGFEKIGRQTLPHVAAKAEVAAEKLRAEAKKIGDEIAEMDKEVSIDVDTKDAKAELGRFKAQYGRLAKDLKPTNDAIRSDFSRVGSVIGGIAGPITTIGKLAAGVTFAGAVGSAYGLKEIVDGLRERTLEMSEDIRRLTLSAEVFNLDIEGSSSEALETVRAMEAIFERFGYEADDLNAIAGALTLEAGKALQGDEGAIAFFSNLGIYKRDVEDTNGQLRSTDKIFAALAKSVSGMNSDLALMRLQELFGEDDGIRLFKVLNSLGENFDDTLDRYRQMIDLRDTDYEASGELQQLLSREALAWENMNRAIFRGFVDPLADATVAREEFAKGVGPLAEEGSRAAGELYASVTKSLTEAATEILTILTDAENGTTPLEDGLKRIADLVDIVMKGIVDIVRYLATGETDAPWLTSLLEKLEALKTGTVEVLGAVKNAADGIAELWGWIDSLLSLLGIDQTWAQVGVVAGLILFRGTIFSVISGITSLVGWIAQVTGATTALGAASAAAARAATTAATTAAGAALKAAPKGGVMAALYEGVDDADMIHHTEKVFERAQEIAREHGDAAGWGYYKAMSDAIEDRDGQGLFAGRLSKWFDENLGTDIFWDDDSYELGVALTVNEDNARDAAKGAMLAFQEAGGWPVDDEGRIEIGAGFTISGAELKAGVVEGLQAQLDAEPLTLTVKQLDLLKGLENVQLEMPDFSQNAPAWAEAGPGATPVAPVTIIIDGERIEGIRATPDSTDKLRQALQRTARARS